MTCNNCKTDCDKRRVVPFVLRQLEEGYKNLVESESKSLLKKYLTRKVLEKLMVKKTSYDSTLFDCIQSGFKNIDSNVGIYASDPEAYTLYADVFNPIIEDCHTNFKIVHKHPPCDWGNVKSFNLEPKEYVLSTKITCRRSLEGYPFSPCLSENQYKEIEEKVAKALKELSGELKGRYHPLSGMSPEDQQKFKDEQLLFEKPEHLQSANCCRFWPTGRGMFFNYEKTFVVWVNREDHIYFISKQSDGDLGRAFTRLINCLFSIESSLKFATNKNLGFLTLCPTNLGTTIEISGRIKVPKLDEDKDKLDKIVQRHKLQIVGTCVEHSEADIGVYDVSIKGKLGLTEYAIAKKFYDGLQEIIEEESKLDVEEISFKLCSTATDQSISYSTEDD